MAKLQTITNFLKRENFEVTITETQAEYASYTKTTLIAHKEDITVKVNKTSGSKNLDETVIYKGEVVNLTRGEYYDLIGFYVIETQRDMVNVLQAMLEKIEAKKQHEEEREGYKEHVLERIELDIEDEEITEAQGAILKNNINYIVDSMMAFFDNHPDCEVEEEWEKFSSIITELLGINYGN